MKTLQIKVELKSPTLLGSGEGWGSIIDADVLFDGYGLPYFPGRRLKGMLRESATEVCEMFSQAGMEGVAKADISGAFGSSGKSEGAAVMFNDLYVENYEETISWLEWSFERFNGLFSPDKILNSLTMIRQQTAIQEDGTARDGSLRTLRVLKPGLRFQGDISFVDSLPIKLIALACANLKRIGTSRNRGLGRIVCALWEKDKNWTDYYVRELKTDG